MSFLAQWKQGFAVSTVTLLISKLLLLDTCSSLASFAAASIPRAISCAADSVKFFSESSRFCIASLVNPQTSLSQFGWSNTLRIHNAWTTSSVQQCIGLSIHPLAGFLGRT